MLIATLPGIHNRDLIKRICSHPNIDGVRYNAGMRTTYSPNEVLSYIKQVTDTYNKRFYVDIKGRQLRITRWADPSYGEIELSHEFDVDLPARIFFRGNEWSNVVSIDGSKIAVSPDPEHALGAGQAVNIIGNNFRIKGAYLTDTDRKYIEAAKQLGIDDYMLSFIERDEDIQEVLSINPNARPVLKIESRPGLAYVTDSYSSEKGILMAARDDLMINIGDNKARMLGALEQIIRKDPSAIAASHLFNSLTVQGFLALADICDLRLLYDMGYKNFMLSDGVSHKCFDEAMKAWRDFQEAKYE